MKVIYVAGPFNHGDNLHGINENINNASKLAIKCWENGWAVICPHKNTAGYQHLSHIPEEVWYKGDLELLRRCDAIIMMENWQTSHGAINERNYAESNDIKIFYEKDGIPIP